jgi:hypothetical protein
MENYPRQEDLARIRLACEPESPIAASDIHNLLAAINKIEKRGQCQIDPPDHGTSLPSYAPTHDARRVAEVMDSLAFLSVAKAKHEVIATALRVDKRTQIVEVIVAANTDVPAGTIAHLETIWCFLKRISEFYRELDPHSSDDDSPEKQLASNRLRLSKEHLMRTCINFSFERFQHYVNSRFEKFIAIDIEGLDPSQPFCLMRNDILRLERLFTREIGARYGKPSLDKLEQWRILCAGLLGTRQTIKKFLATRHISSEINARLSNFKKLDSYLQKINSLMTSINIVVKAAISPHCRYLFGYKFGVKPLKGVTWKAPQVPTTPKDWEGVLEAAAGRMQTERYRLNLDVIKPDATHIAKEGTNDELLVHCETKLLVDIFESEHNNQQLAKAYTYLGVSKLSCHGCYSFISAFNDVHDTNFMTKGTHQKSYYPWLFPIQDFTRKERVLLRTYWKIATLWVKRYEGYSPYTVSLRPDSTAPSSLGEYVDLDSDSLDKFRQH